MVGHSGGNNLGLGNTLWVILKALKLDIRLIILYSVSTVAKLCDPKCFPHLTEMIQLTQLPKQIPDE